MKTDAAIFPKWLLTKYQSMPYDNQKKITFKNLLIFLHELL
jgi:hypothetical protein